MLSCSAPRRRRPGSLDRGGGGAAARRRRRPRARPPRGAKAAFKPKFFTAHEYATVRVLVDIIIPKDERSGSATDAGVPEFMDFMMVDQPNRQTPMRGGLAWIDLRVRGPLRQALPRLHAPQQRTAVLDDIAWPQKAKPEFAHGVAFFNSFRDLTASGFWSSKMGVRTCSTWATTMVAEWKGCPDEALKKLGVTRLPTS